jgi:hypothetical protein
MNVRKVIFISLLVIAVLQSRSQYLNTVLPCCFPVEGAWVTAGFWWEEGIHVAHLFGFLRCVCCCVGLRVVFCVPGVACLYRLSMLDCSFGCFLCLFSLNNRYRKPIKNEKSRDTDNNDYKKRNEDSQNKTQTSWCLVKGNQLIYLIRHSPCYLYSLDC